MIKQMTVQKKSLKDSRNVRKSEIKAKDSYRNYKKTIKEKGKGRKSEFNIPSTLHTKILLMFDEKIREKMLEGRSVELPAGLGELFISKQENKNPNKNKRVDFGHWRKTGEVRFHLNEHTDYYYASTYWKRRKVANIRRFWFEPCRILERSIAKKSKEEGLNDFIEVRVLYKPREIKKDDLSYDFE